MASSTAIMQSSITNNQVAAAQGTSAIRPMMEKETPSDPSKRYTKGDIIGRGSQKVVYKAFDEEEGVEVAWNEIPVAVDSYNQIDTEQKKRMLGEVRLLSGLKHRNILTLHDWWLDKKSSVLVFITELLNDGNLRQYRMRHKNVDTGVIKRWAWQILQGLVYLHGHNPPIIHRDLKSDNIFINGASGTLKIGDLGFASFRAGFSSGTGAMSVVGTPEFMAPELYEEQYDEKVDIYSFGLCLMELATLEYPYSECRNAAQIYKKVTQGIPPQGITRINDGELKEFVLLCIRQDPHQRPEARQLLKHPFFEAVKNEASRKGTSPSAMTAAASFAALCQASASNTSAGGVGNGHTAGYSAQRDMSVGNGTAGGMPSIAALTEAYGSVAQQPTSSPAATLPRSNSVTISMLPDAQATITPLGHVYDPLYRQTTCVSDLTSQADGAAAATCIAAAALDLKNGPFGVPKQPPPSVSTHTSDSKLGAGGGAGGGVSSRSTTPEMGRQASSMTDMSEELIFDEEGDGKRDGGGTGAAHEDYDELSLSMSPKARLAIQRSKECKLVEEDSEDDMESQLDALGQRLRLACRDHDGSMLTFTMSFVNHSGTRKKVGFQYDMDADTAAEVAGEMIDNLSLNTDEAGFIASLIQKELQRRKHEEGELLGPPGGPLQLVAPKQPTAEQEANWFAAQVSPSRQGSELAGGSSPLQTSALTQMIGSPTAGQQRKDG